MGDVLEIKLSDTCYYKSFLQNVQKKLKSVLFRFQECKGKREASEERIGEGFCFAPSPDTRVSYPTRSLCACLRSPENTRENNACSSG